MPCQNCGSDSINPCSCSNGYNAFTVSTTNVTIANPMTIPVSNTGQYTGVWARVGQIVFIQGYGYYQVSASTATSITVVYPASPFVGGTPFTPNSVDYDNSGTIISGAKISPGGVKGADGTDSGLENIQVCFTDASTTNNVAFTEFPAPASPVTLMDPSGNTAPVGGVLNVDGDTIEIVARFFGDIETDSPGSPGGPIGQFRIMIDDGIAPVNISDYYTVFDWQLNNKLNFYEIKILVKRETSTTASCEISLFRSSGATYALESASILVPPGDTEFWYWEREGVTGFNIDWVTNPIIIRFYGRTDLITDEIKLGHYYITTYKQIV